MIKVGCCGFPVSQARYYETFNLVELNNTFYAYPSLSSVKRWRDKAPEGFEFTVKSHQDISHKYKLRLEQALEPFEKVKQICRTLNAKVILIQTPASFSLESLGDAERFFRGINREDFTLVWETRGPSWESGDGIGRLRGVLSELGITHVTDPFRLMPASTHGLAYFRLHGLGERAYYYQYTDDELKRLYDLVRRFEGLEMGVYVLFNNLSMFEDASRFAFFLKNGCFPPLTGSFGIDSVRLIISKTRYPTTKSTLLNKIGWRLVEDEDGRQIRLKELMKNIPTRTYKNPDEVLKELK